MKVKGTRIERGIGDARAALVDVARYHEQIAAGRGQRAHLGRIVGLAVLMRGAQRDRAARGGEGRLEAVGQTLAVVVVGVGHRDRGDAAILQDVGHDLALARVRRRGAEEQPVILGRREAGRGRRGRDHHDAVGARDVLEDGARHTRAIRAHDAVDLVRGHQTLGGSLGRGGVDAGRVAADRGDRVPAAQQRARRVDLVDRKLGTRRHVGREGFERAGKAQHDADLDVFGRGRAGHQRGGGRGQKQFAHVRAP